MLSVLWHVLSQKQNSQDKSVCENTLVCAQVPMPLLLFMDCKPVSKINRKTNNVDIQGS